MNWSKPDLIDNIVKYQHLEEKPYLQEPRNCIKLVQLSVAKENIEDKAHAQLKFKHSLDFFRLAQIFLFLDAFLIL